MKMEHAIKARIIKNILLSIFLYALPVILMFLSFYITGERPWENKNPPPAKTENQNSK